MSNHLLKDAVVFIVGKQYEEIADILDSTKHVNEFLIAKKLDITINQTRNILYRLSDYGIVSSTRKKDKKKGWYTYFWRIERIKALEFLRGIIERRAGTIKNQIDSRENNQFFVCNTCHVEFTQENALLMDFTCNECGNVFEVKDNTKVIRGLKKNYEKYGEELREIDENLSKEREKVEKKKEKELKKEKEEKAKKRAAKRAEKQAAKKTTKKATKGSTKKATKKATKKTAKKTVKKMSSKATKKKVSKKTSKKAKKVAKKTTKSSKKKTTKKIAKKSSGKKKASKKSK